MNLEIQHRGVRLSESMRELISERIQSAVGRMAPRLRKVLVRLDATRRDGCAEDVSAYVELIPVTGSRRALMARSASSHPLASVGLAADRAVRQLRRARTRWIARRRKSA